MFIKMVDLKQIGVNAKHAAGILSGLTSARKDAALEAMAAALIARKNEILEANSEDVTVAEANGISRALLDRLKLTPERIDGMAGGIRKVIALTDPVGEVVGGHRHPNGMRIQKTRVPLGVIGIICEARPNVTSDAAALCLKAGNASILRGGKDSLRSNVAITAALRAGIAECGIPEDAVQLIEDASRESAAEMMKMREYIDVLIPRGGAGLIRAVVEQSTVPVIETGVGICHVYLDAAADCDMAVSVTVNAKASRPSVCNAAETLLVHRDIAEQMLPLVAAGLVAADVELRGCETTRKLLKDMDIKAATEDDWVAEYSDYIMAVKVVDSLDVAVAHIAQYGSGHSECIITNSVAAADKFSAAVDAAAVYVNVSTRFTDGEEFGMGAEIGISTQKLHTRGPMGLSELTTVKYIISGEGQIR